MIDGLFIAKPLILFWNIFCVIFIEALTEEEKEKLAKIKKKMKRKVCSSHWLQCGPVTLFISHPCLVPFSRQE